MKQKKATTKAATKVVKKVAPTKVAKKNEIVEKETITSDNTIKILLVAAIVISIIAITLSMIAVNKVSIPAVVQDDAAQPENTGEISLEVPPSDTEAGSMVILEVGSGQI